MLILCANVGSTSFKYQIIDAENSQTLVKGVVERIGNPPSPFTHTVPGKPVVEGELDAPSHNEAIAHTLRLITHPEQGAIQDLSGLAGGRFQNDFRQGALAFCLDYGRSARSTRSVHPTCAITQPRLSRIHPRVPKAIAADTAGRSL